MIDKEMMYVSITRLMHLHAAIITKCDSNQNNSLFIK